MYKQVLYITYLLLPFWPVKIKLVLKVFKRRFNKLSQLENSYYFECVYLYLYIYKCIFFSNNYKPVGPNIIKLKIPHEGRGLRSILWDVFQHLKPLTQKLEYSLKYAVFLAKKKEIKSSGLHMSPVYTCSKILSSLQ